MTHSNRGYVLVRDRTHPNAAASGIVREHIAVVAAALGKRVPSTAPVHHVNCDRSDNRPQNLVLCDSHEYHSLLHKRQRAYDECGNADYLNCRYCKQWDAPENLWLRERRIARRRSGGKRLGVTTEAYHRWCHAADMRRRKTGGGRGLLPALAKADGLASDTLLSVAECIQTLTPRETQVAPVPVPIRAQP